MVFMREVTRLSSGYELFSVCTPSYTIIFFREVSLPILSNRLLSCSLAIFILTVVQMEPLFLFLVQLKMRFGPQMAFRLDLTDITSEGAVSFSLEADLILKCLFFLSWGRALLLSSVLLGSAIIKRKPIYQNYHLSLIISGLIMAERLSKVYGTEMDKVNCPFYYKIGACRYGDSCERIHNKPPISETVLLEHMYENNAVETAIISGNVVTSEDAEKALTKFETFFEEVFKEMSQYGQIEDMIIVDNLGDHIVGNVYVKYSDEDYSENALNSINGRFFNGKKISAVFSPVTDFLNAKCKQYIDGSCKRGGYCNYMHVKPFSKSFKKELFQNMYIEHPEYRIKKQQDSDDSFERRRRERKRERKDKKHSKKKERGSRSRSEHKKKKEDRRSRSPRDSSEERRNIIAEWNEEIKK